LPRMETWLNQIVPGEPWCITAHPADETSGVGLIEAARGSLGHWLTVRRGRIHNYQIIAPTTWNFSPRDAGGQPGALEQALAGLPATESTAHCRPRCITSCAASIRAWSAPCIESQAGSARAKLSASARRRASASSSLSRLARAGGQVLSRAAVAVVACKLVDLLPGHMHRLMRPRQFGKTRHSGRSARGPSRPARCRSGRHADRVAAGVAASFGARHATESAQQVDPAQVVDLDRQ
jgi:hypothetical protein